MEMECNESRNCSCNLDMNNNDIVALDNKLMIMGDDENMLGCDTREKMLYKIKCCAFAIQELTLYLDTHPEDEKALCLHNKYAKEYRMLTDKYQKMYGPLTSKFPCNKWRWIEEPWPWEGGIK